MDQVLSKRVLGASLSGKQASLSGSASVHPAKMPPIFWSPCNVLLQHLLFHFLAVLVLLEMKARAGLYPYWGPNMFSQWIPVPPGACPPDDTPQVFVNTTGIIRVCPSSGDFITGLTVVAGFYQGASGIWRVSGTCSSGSNLTFVGPSEIQEPREFMLSFPYGIPSIYGQSSNSLNQLYGWPDLQLEALNGAPWILHCPTGNLISGVQAWATPVSDPPPACLALAIRFQCNGSDPYGRFCTHDRS